MKEILLITTGGTIASVPGAEGLVPGLTPDQLTSFLPLEQLQIILSTKNFFALDSINMQPHHWQRLAQEIFAQRNQYDGIVISHGTDTMAYTASALSFMLPNINVPVVLTGSMLPMDHPASDGPNNLAGAILTAAAERPGVMIVFNDLVIRGVRASKVDSQAVRAFASINAPALGRIENGTVVFSQSPALPAGPPQLTAELETRLLTIKLVPGMSPDMMAALPGLGIKGLIVEAFGGGGVPFVDQGNLVPALKSVITAGVPVVMATQSLTGGVHLETYQPGQKAAALGIISGQDLTKEAMVVKLMWVLGQTSDPQRVREMMAHNYCGEQWEA